MYFQIVGEIVQIEVVAVGHGVRTLASLRKRFGSGRWRKLKGIATVRTPCGRLRRAEVHWYEAHGVGKRGIKVKRFLD